MVCIDFFSLVRKKGHVFYLGGGSRNSNRFGVFSYSKGLLVVESRTARFGFEASLSSATFRLWEAGVGPQNAKLEDGWKSWDNSHVSRFFLWGFVWNTSFFFLTFWVTQLPSHPFIFDHLWGGYNTPFITLDCPMVLRRLMAQSKQSFSAKLISLGCCVF